MPKTGKIIKDLTGKKFGELTVLKFSHFKGHNSMWQCKCSCGNEIFVRGGDLSYGTTKFCDKIHYFQENDYMVGTNHDGYRFLFDISDFEKVEKYKWYGVKEYAEAYDIKTNKNFKMHNLLLNPEEGKVIDHINRDPSDNRRNNLRICNQQQNVFNTRGKNHTSVYKGVSWQKSRNKWFAVIGINGKTYNLGRYNNEIDAAKAYNKKAIELFGEFAYLNDI